MRDPEDVPRPATLGERLNAVGAELAARHLTTYPWAAGLGPALRRAAELNASWAQRFERHEADGPPPPTPRRRFAASPASPAPGEAAPSPAPAETERGLPVDVRARLGAVAGPGAAVMRVLTGSAADTQARGQRADAVTSGTDVRMRAGKLQPDTPEGLALLAHEASHVTAALRRGGAAAAHHTSPGGAEAEEREALQVERATRQQASRAPGAPGARGTAALFVSSTAGAAGVNGTVSPPNGSAPALAGPAMRADIDRTEATVAPAGAPQLDLEALRRDLIEELMHRVRTDFERGG